MVRGGTGLDRTRHHPRDKKRSTSTPLVVDDVETGIALRVHGAWAWAASRSEAAGRSECTCHLGWRWCTRPDMSGLASSSHMFGLYCCTDVSCMDLIVVGYDINFDMTRLQSADTYRRETPNEQTVMNTSLLAACCSLDVSSFAEKRLLLQNTISRSRLLPVPKPMLITCLLQT